MAKISPKNKEHHYLLKKFITSQNGSAMKKSKENLNRLVKKT